MAFLAAIPASLAAMSTAATGATAAGTVGSVGATAAGTVGATAAATGGWLSTALTGLSILGTGISALSSIQQGQTQSDIYEANARLAERQGEAAVEQGKEKSRILSQQRRQLIGTQVAMYGGAGVDITGSPLDVISDTYSNYERDIQTTGYNADVARRTSQAQADIYRWGAARAETAGYMKAGTTILGGVGKSLLSTMEV